MTPIPGAPFAPPFPDHSTATPPEGVDPLSFRVFHAYMRALHSHRTLMGALMGEEGGPAQAGCLRVLSGHDGISQRDLGELLFLSAPSVTTMLQRMERRGIIVRRPDPEDQRLTRVHMTPEGRALDERLREKLVGYIERMFAGMSEADRLEFERLLRLMADNTTKAAE